MHLHEIDTHEEWLIRLGYLIEIVGRRFLHVRVQEGNPDDPPVGRIYVLAVDFELLSRRFTSVSRHRSFGHLIEHGAEVRAHVREPLRITIGVGV